MRVAEGRLSNRRRPPPSRGNDTYRTDYIDRLICRCVMFFDKYDFFGLIVWSGIGSGQFPLPGTGSGPSNFDQVQLVSPSASHQPTHPQKIIIEKLL